MARTGASEGGGAKRRRTHPLFSGKTAAVGDDDSIDVVPPQDVAQNEEEEEGRIERRRLVDRWHAFADPILVAARLHAVVLRAMGRLRGHFNGKDARGGGGPLFCLNII